MGFDALRAFWAEAQGRAVRMAIKNNCKKLSTHRIRTCSLWITGELLYQEVPSTQGAFRCRAPQITICTPSNKKCVPQAVIVF